MQFSFRRLMAGLAVCGCGLLLNEPLVCAANEGRLLFSSLPKARYHFDGFVGERIDRNVEQWLLRAPEANPGMVEMFRLRDREPKPELVPWAGEFVGKYLISAIQALRMVDRPDLRGRVQETLDALISTQAEDGYLGPFRREVRLTGNWDLWGHYHCMLALLMWHDETGAAAALRACRRAADLICATFLDSNRRVFDAGSPEMNMAVVHSLGWLYRLTREPRYWQMMEAIEKDWERAGDYLRAGVAGLEFFETPRPRWESLHDLQGLLEFYRITGEDKYQTAFAHHWRSILRWDRRNTGGFSSGEQATGNPYAATAIETCCTVAWMALSVDMLRLSGDARAADELELSFYNAALGAQHPSGRWCTYNTPMDGAREASAHTIVFQSRAGTPELNCCSVNGPRALGLLSEWAVMTNRDGLVVNYYGPGSFEGVLADGTPLRLRWITDYPRSGKVLLSVDPSAAREFSLSLRVPAWSAHTSVELNDRALPEPGAGRCPGRAAPMRAGDRLLLTFDLRLQAVPRLRAMWPSASPFVAGPSCLLMTRPGMETTRTASQRLT
ncbi:MAG: glycoside hydrolase family 127 protein [Verrucomicrobiota bacterium]